MSTTERICQLLRGPTATYMQKSFESDINPSYKCGIHFRIAMIGTYTLQLNLVVNSPFSAYPVLYTQSSVMYRSDNHNLQVN